MPDLDSSLHIRMWRRSRLLRVVAAVRRELRAKPIYGIEWGDVDAVPPLAYIRDHYLTPYVKANQTCVEIGPGGGRWTQYLLGFKRVYAVDFHPEILDELRKIDAPNLTLIQNSGTDFPNVPSGAVDFLFSFGVFVHLEAHLIKGYLENMRAILAPGANVVIQYGDKTKTMAQSNKGFANNSPDLMRAMVNEAGFKILEEDLTSLWHSAVVRFTIA